MIRNDVNGRLFTQNTDIVEYCNYITNIFTNYFNYKNLALSAFNEYQTRLNWSVAGRTVKNLIMEYTN